MMSSSTNTPRILSVDSMVEPVAPVRSAMNEEEFFALCDSLRAVGQLCPVIVKPRGELFEIVAGHRRLKAARYLRWKTLMAIVVENNEDLNDAIKLHENSFREDIAPEDEGKYFQHLALEKKMGIKEVANFVGRSCYYVESRLKCITWPADIRDALRACSIGLSVAEALADISEDAERRRLLTYANEHGVSARTARAWADTWRSTATAVDPAAIAAAVAATPIHYSEPMFPCFGCERPIAISALQTIRLCKECFNDINHRPEPTSTNLHHIEGRSFPPTGTQAPPEALLQ